jgi:TonB family protein
MTGASKTEVTATGFAPHIEELHEFFRSRGVKVGAPEDLTPFVERLSKDTSFRDEMASMMRAIIYRERDGLMPAELLELLVTAVAGTPPEDAPEQVRDAVRQMMGFLGGVFRSRWNPGVAGAPTEDRGAGSAEIVAGPAEGAKAEDNAAAISAEEEPVGRPMTPIFYQAQVVANGGEEPEAILPVRGTSGAAETALDLAAGEEVTAPVAAFLRGENVMTAPHEPERRRSRGWMWVAVIFAVVLAFCAGMLSRQWMLSRYGVAWPWHLPSALTARLSSAPSANSGAGAPAGGAAGVPAGRSPAALRRRARVEAARSVWPGGSESASDLTPREAPASGAAGSEAPAGGAAKSVPWPGDQGAVVSAAGGAIHAGGSQPMGRAAKTSPEAANAGEARATAMVGASPGLMGSRLLFAPEPEYPESAQRAHVQGSVVVETLVGRDGSVVRAQAISGDPLLREAAEQAVYGRRYRPYVVNDIPMAVRTLVTVNFRLP